MSRTADVPASRLPARRGVRGGAPVPRSPRPSSARRFAAVGTALLVALALAVAPGTALAAPGDLDARWGADGWSTPFAAAEETAGAFPQGDGTAVLVGSALFPLDAAPDDQQPAVAVARVTDVGAPDTSFAGGDGIAPVPGLAGRTALDAEQLPGGDLLILAGGQGSPASRLVRTDGAGQVVRWTVDAAFDDADLGGAYDGGSAEGRVLALAGDRVLVGGALVSAGGARQHAVLAYDLATGTLDTGYGALDGAATLDGNPGYGHLLSADASGRAYVVSEVPGAWDWWHRHRVRRLTDDGVLDASFGSGGSVAIDYGTAPGEIDEIGAIQALPDGVAIGGGPSDGQRVRLLDDTGAPVTTFGDDGEVLLPLGPSGTVGSFAVVEGVLHALGARNTAAIPERRLVTARFDADGLEPTWGEDGIAVTAIGPLTTPKHVAVTADGFLLVAGRAFAVGAQQFVAGRVDLLASRPAVLRDGPKALDQNGDPGPLQPGEELHAVAASWFYGGETQRLWQRCDSARAAESPLAVPTDCATIAGATGATYTTTDADRAKHLRVVERNVSPAGTVSAASRTAAVEDPTIAVTFTTHPAVAPAGAVPAGSTLRATWATTGGHAGGSATVTWFRCVEGRVPACQPLSAGEDDPSDDAYVTVAGDVGATFRAVVEVRGGHAGELASAQTTNATAVVAAGGATAPSSTTRPTIATPSSTRVGTTLTVAGNGTWDRAGLTFIYRWQRCSSGGASPGGCVGTGGAGSAYGTTADDAGRWIRLVVDAREGTGPIGSAASDPVRIDPLPQPQQEDPIVDAPPRPAVVFTRTVDTTRTARMPDVRGLKVDDARARIVAAGIHADIDVVEAIRAKPLKRDGKPLDIGDVSGQSVAARTSITTSIGALRKIRLVTEAGPKASRADGGALGSVCTGKEVRDDLVRVDFSDVLNLLKAKRCDKLDLSFTVTKAVRQLEVRRATKRAKKLQLEVRLPGNPDNLDLVPVLRQGAFTRDAPFGRDDWALTADARNVFGVQVLNRAGQTVDGAEVLVDGSDVGAADATRAATGGIAVIGGFRPTKAGTVTVVVAQRDARGNRIFGITRFRVLARKAGFVGIDGRRYTKAGALDATSRTRAERVARVRATGFGALLEALGALARSLGDAVGRAFSGAVSEQTITTAAARNQASIVLLGGANVVSAGGANVVSAGGANVVSAGGANVVSAGGANVVAPGGANVVAAGGANVVSIGGSGLMSLASGAVISAGGGNVMGGSLAPNGQGALLTSPAGHSLISKDGLRLLSDNGLGVVAAGGAN